MNQKISTQGYEYWFEDDIIVIHVKPVPPTMETLSEIFDLLDQLDKKYPVLIDPRQGVAINKEQRAFTTERFSKIATAVSMLNNNLFTPMVLKFALKFNSPPYPLSMHNSHKKAKDWLANFPPINKEKAHRNSVSELS